MNRKLLVATAAALLSASAWAQGVKVYDTGRKWDPVFDALLQGKTAQRVAARGLQTATPQDTVRANVTVSDAEAVAQFVREGGYEADVITPSLVTVSVAAPFIAELGERDDVKYISETRQLHPFLNNARSETGVDKVTAGEGLETPFTGKGVVVGIIDQGFEYGHPAFDNRVVRWGQNAMSGSLTKTKPTRKDSKDTNGHATHVSNIAAGSRVGDCPYYGIATGADLIQISSDFDNSSVLKQVKAIKSYAEGEGQPWVVNMSFGAILGPHDGTTEFDQGMDELTGPGGILVAAMGNSGGENLHALRTIDDESKPVYLYLHADASNTDKVFISEIWSAEADGQSHLTITPVVVINGKLYEVDTDRLGTGYSSGINALNNRQYARLQAYTSTLLTAAGAPSATSGVYVMWRVTGEKGTSFHAWVDNTSYSADFYTKGTPYAASRGDDDYLVGEGAASVPSAIAVGSYNNPTKFTSWNGSSYDYRSYVGSEGYMSSFTSNGPQIVDRPKPTISAPGGVIVSAYSKNASEFSASAAEVSQSVTVSGSQYYYGVMSGTSQASPMVTGIVALWLEANPKLTYDDIIKIFKETGRRSTTTTGKADENGWNATSGYGKIDAYEGLKKALEMANASGINETLNTSAPVTLQKGDASWRVLFNNDESYADIRLYSLGGSLIESQHLSKPRRGEEHTIELAGRAPGVYVVSISTTASTLTRKVVVK